MNPPKQTTSMAVVRGPCDCGRMTRDATVAGFEAQGGQTGAKGRGQPLKAGKGLERDSFPAPPERTAASDTFDFSPVESCQNDKILHLYCFNLLSL